MSFVSTVTGVGDQERFERKQRAGTISTGQLGKLQTLQEAEALAEGAYAVDDQEVQQLAQEQMAAGGAQVQSAAQELAGAQLAGGGRQRGNITSAMKALGTGAAQAGAQAARSARELLTQVAESKIQAAKARILGESQFQRQLTQQYVDTLMKPASEGVSAGVTAGFTP